MNTQASQLQTRSSTHNRTAILAPDAEARAKAIRLYLLAAQLEARTAHISDR